MSNPEKRDDRSMSDILASIRKLMAQEPDVAPSGPTRSVLNGVSGASIDLQREPELKLPPRDPAPGGAAPADAVSLDELLAGTPRAVPLSAAAPGPAALQAGLGARLEAGPQRDPPAPAKGASPKEEDAAGLPVAKAPNGAMPPVVVARSAAESANGTAAPTPSGVTGAPPLPKIGDLGDVVPGKRAGDGSPQHGEAGALRPNGSERQMFGAPITAPLPGEPARTPASEAMPEVPGDRGDDSRLRDLP